MSVVSTVLLAKISISDLVQYSNLIFCPTTNRSQSSDARLASRPGTMV